MKVCAISDLHGHFPEVPSCDILLMAGDVLPLGSHEQARQIRWIEEKLIPWLDSVDAKQIVAVAGNHDFIFDQMPSIARALPWRYLVNEACIVDGLKIWGSPYALPYGPFPFMAKEHVLEQMWERIPSDADVVMTHGPAYGILDRARRGVLTGSESLRRRLIGGIGTEPPLLHVCGHIHEAYGMDRIGPTFFVNASVTDLTFKLANDPIVVEVNRGHRTIEIQRADAA